MKTRGLPLRCSWYFAGLPYGIASLMSYLLMVSTQPQVPELSDAASTVQALSERQVQGIIQEKKAAKRRRDEMRWPLSRAGARCESVSRVQVQKPMGLTFASILGPRAPTPGSSQYVHTPNDDARDNVVNKGSRSRSRGRGALEVVVGSGMDLSWSG